MSKKKNKNIQDVNPECTTTPVSSDENTNVENKEKTPEVKKEASEKQKLSKGVVAAFAIMGTAIVVLSAALIATNLDSSSVPVAGNATTGTTGTAVSVTGTSGAETSVSENVTTATASGESQAATTEESKAAETEATTVKPAEKGITLTYSVDNSWESGSEHMYGVQFGITNNSGNSKA